MRANNVSSLIDRIVSIQMQRLRDMFEAAIAKAAQSTEQARNAGETKNATQKGGVEVQFSTKAEDLEMSGVGCTLCSQIR